MSTGDMEGSIRLILLLDPRADKTKYFTMPIKSVQKEVWTDCA